MVVWLLLLAALVVAAVLVLRALWGKGRPSEPGTPGERHAVQILEERNARGEIDQEEFEEHRRTLRP